MTRSHRIPAADVLRRNLVALAQTQPRIYERVHWPVEGGHLVLDADGAWRFQLNASSFDFEQSDTLVAEGVGQTLAVVREGEELLLFGLGLGEHLEALLREAPDRMITAWDRDPWILRQVLSVRDWSAELEAGRLRFALDADLVPLIESGQNWCVLHHPILSGVYANEARLLRDGLCEKRALVCVGSLFVDSLAEALRGEGFSVFSFDVQNYAAEELQLVVEAYRPALVASINYVHGTAEFCQALDLDYICWEVDPATDEPEPLAAPAPRAHVFTYREANVSSFRRAGFGHVEYLPLATDPEKRIPVELSDEEQGRYGARISFVGTSLMRNVAGFQLAFEEQFSVWRPQSGDEGTRAFVDLIVDQREGFSGYRIPERLEEKCPGFRAFCRDRSLQDPALLAAEIAAAEKRLNYVSELADHGMVAWGDDGWAQVEPLGVDYRGPALHETELPLIYSGSTINLDINRIYQGDIVTMRIFDILACGGFVLAEHCDALADLFDIGSEIESYRTLAELQDKVAHYLANPGEARTIAERGRFAVLTRHNIPDRVRTMLERCSGEEPSQRVA